MKNNLYDKINYLVNRKYELKRLGGIIKFDKTQRVEYERYALEYTQIEDTLDYIRKNCVISPLKVAEIISEKEGTPYVLKIFMECVVRVLINFWQKMINTKKNKRRSYDI